MCLDRYAEELANKPKLQAKTVAEIPDTMSEDEPSPEMANDETNGGNKSGSDSQRQQEDAERIEQLEAQMAEQRAAAEAENAEITYRLESENSELRRQLQEMTEEIQN